MAARLESLTDEQLMVSCQAATAEEAGALTGELARRHFVRVTGFIQSIVGDASAAQDLAQEAFVRVHVNRTRYKDVGRFSTWLLTIARNLALNEVRNRKHRPALVVDVAPHDSAQRPAVEDTHASKPPEDAARDDVKTLVHRAIADLEDHHREVVVLCDIEERSYAEAAEVLGVPIGTVRSRLFRAREQLARALRGVLGEEAAA